MTSRLMHSYDTNTAACARSGEWSHALQLFVAMRTDRIKCDRVAYNALCSAFTNGGKSDLVRTFARGTNLFFALFNRKSSLHYLSGF